MKCRVCEASARSIGSVEYYSGFPFEIIQCQACGCRSTTYDPQAYDALYSEPNSIYGIYNETAARTEKLFKQGDLTALQSELSQSPKYRFVISLASDLPKSAKVLEIGSSRGHLTSYFILRGNPTIGADISREAVKGANEVFGPYFFHIDSPEIANNAPYDLIYHVGTIGCVPDPIGLTRRLLAMLAPNGVLAFNAPVLEACYLKGQLWNDAANPPDLVTLFPSGFFARLFGRTAKVEERLDHMSDRDNIKAALRKAFTRWKPPTAIPINQSLSDYQSGRHHETIVERGAIKLASKIGLHRWLAKRPTPFGYYVTMSRR